MNESLKNSLEKPINVVEEKRKNGQAKNLHKKDQHVYNNYYELRSGAINYIRHLQLVFFSPTIRNTTDNFYHFIYQNVDSKNCPTC